MLNDPLTFRVLIPGLTRIRASGRDQYLADAKIKVGFLNSSFNNISIKQTTNDVQYSTTLDIRGEEASKLGSFHEILELKLQEDDSSTTTLKIHADITMTGKLASLGRRVVEWKARELTAAVVKNLSRAIEQL
ncbi:hypothetical protein CL673_05255 [Candidatus Bathyarchaeota archaeon]|jgi:carbon monoxide dehydrogenase subunit G|nr:hypothetical protein [Candidatus Bathyarchaeota archaeon]|tara:strand:+ start:394 stop:792 length:399 start_codon:yes stop_codon:yes gene_type:complete